jgi:hypothetical protein
MNSFLWLCAGLIFGSLLDLLKKWIVQRATEKNSRYKYLQKATKTIFLTTIITVSILFLTLLFIDEGVLIPHTLFFSRYIDSYASFNLIYVTSQANILVKMLFTIGEYIVLLISTFIVLFGIIFCLSTIYHLFAYVIWLVNGEKAFVDDSDDFADNVSLIVPFLIVYVLLSAFSSLYNTYYAPDLIDDISITSLEYVDYCPDGQKVNSYKLEWNFSENANYYSISLNGKAIYTTKNNYYYLNKYQAPIPFMKSGRIAYGKINEITVTAHAFGVMKKTSEIITFIPERSTPVPSSEIHGLCFGGNRLYAYT